MIYIYMGDSEGLPMASQFEQYRLASDLADNGFDACILFDDDNRLERIASTKQLKNRAKGHDVAQYAREIERLSDYRLTWFDEYRDVKVIGLKSLENIEITHTDMFIFPEYAKNIAYQIKETPALKVMAVYNITSLAIQSSAIMSFIHDLKIADFIVPNRSVAKWIKDNHKRESNLFRFHVRTPLVSDYFKPRYKKPKVFVYAKNQDDVALLHKVFCERYPSLSWVQFEVAFNMNKSEFSKKLGESAVSVQLDRRCTHGTLIAESVSCGTMPVSLIGDYESPMYSLGLSANTIVGSEKENGRFYDLCECVSVAIMHFLHGGDPETETATSEDEALEMVYKLIDARKKIAIK